MINVLIPITENLQDYSKMITSISMYSDVNIIVGITESLNEKVVKEDNVNYFVFENAANKEEILNALGKFVLAGKILILKKPLSKKDFEKVIFTKEKIVVQKIQPKNRFVAFFTKIWHAIVKLFFGVAFYEGDTSVIMFNEDLADVLIQTGNISYNSRVNRWRGITEQTIDLDDKNKVGYPVDKKQNLIYSVMVGVLIAFAVLFTTLISIFVNINFIIGLLIVCVDILCIFTSILLIMMMIFNNKVGKKNVEQAKIIEKD